MEVLSNNNRKRTSSSLLAGLPPSPWNGTIAPAGACHHHPPMVMRPFTMMPQSTIPLAPSSFQVWKKPYSMSHGAVGGQASGGGVSGFNPFKLSDERNVSSDKNPSVINGFLAPSSTQYSQYPQVLSPPPPPPAVGGGSGGSGGDNCINTGRATEGSAGCGKNHHRSGRSLETNMDPKKLKRILSNRVSAQKSRQKKLQYVSEMEKKVKALQAQIAVLSPQVTLFKNQRQMLRAEHKKLNQAMTDSETNQLQKEAEIEHHRSEVCRLKQLENTLLEQRVKDKATVQSTGWGNGGLEHMIINPAANNMLQYGGGLMGYNPNQDAAQYGEPGGQMDDLSQLYTTKHQEQQQELAEGGQKLQQQQHMPPAWWEPSRLEQKTTDFWDHVPVLLQDQQLAGGSQLAPAAGAPPVQKASMNCSNTPEISEIEQILNSFNVKSIDQNPLNCLI